MTVLELSSRGVDDTAAVAAAVAEVTVGGDLLVLSGDLGAGKTAFTKSFAAALGVEAPVTSPTFTLANRYEGRLVVHHLDAYRLEGMAEVRDLGLDELIAPDAVTVIEWGDTIEAVLPRERLEIRLTLPDDPHRSDDDRQLSLTSPGATWGDRLTQVRDRLLASGADVGRRVNCQGPPC